LTVPTVQMLKVRPGVSGRAMGHCLLNSGRHHSD
jgi:hypothetical protein